MALKKPSDFFGKKVEEDNLPEVKFDNALREELDKVESLSEQLYQLQQDISQKVVKNDLESLVLSQINMMRENFETLQNEFKQSNKSDLSKFKEIISEITEIVNNLVEEEIPKYKKQLTKNELYVDKQVNQLQETVENNISEIREEIGEKFNDVAEFVGNNIEYFNEKFEETSLQVKKTTETYTNISKILENNVSKENEKFQEYSELIESLQKTLFGLKTQIFINEKEFKRIDDYLQEHHKDLINLKEEVFGEIKKLSVGNLQENLERLEKKIDYIKETYSKIEPEIIVQEVIKEGLLNGPPETKNSDPLTPLNQNFVTLDQLQEHYRLFINRIQQQLATIGGGGETRLEFLDDIDRDSAKINGRFLKYDAATGKWVGALGGGGGGSQTLDDTLGLGNTSSFGMSVGIITATSFIKSGGTSSQFLKADGSVDTSTYATQSYVGLATVGLSSVSYVDSKVGLSTSGLASVSYVDSKVGLATVGLLASTGNGSNLTGIVTSIVAGNNITISGSTGQVTINASGGGVNYWTQSGVGIVTTSNVGIATTNPTSPLTVFGDALIIGIVTATDFNSASDIKLKDNISVIDNPLDKIVKLKGVNFQWKETGKKSLGVIAQEVEKVLPELVSGEESKTVNYNGLIGLLIECVKYQQKEIEELKKFIDK